MPAKKSSSRRDPPPRSPLRARAEALLGTTRTDVSSMSAEDVQALVYEFQVHQIELQIQNEELRDTQMELAESLERYSDLYEFAPIAYLTLDVEGTITEANLAAGTLLGVNRRDLVGSKMMRFVHRGSQDLFLEHRQSVLAGEAKRECELEMHAADGTPILVRIESIASGPLSDRRCLTALLDITMMRRAEEAGRENILLEKSFEDQGGELKYTVERIRLLSAAIDHLGEGVLITGAELDWPGPEIVFVNGAMCRVSGYEAGELVGKTPRIFQGKATDRGALARLKEELLRGEACQIEVVNYRKDGTPYDAEVFVTPLVDSEGNCSHFVSIHRDITRRKQREAALRERKELLRAILNAVGDAIITVENGGEIVSANPATEEMFGYGMAELIGKNVKALMPESFRGKPDAHLARYHETGGAHVIGSGRDAVARRNDGTTFPIDLSVGKVDDLGLYTLVVHEITDRKRNEEALRIEHEFSESLIETTRSIILVLDPDGRVIRFNKVFERLSGWSLEASEGCDWFERFLPERIRKETRELFARAIGGEPTRGNIGSILTKVGEERLIEWYDATLFDAEGHQIGLLCSGNDVTERLHLEQEVHKVAEMEKQRIARDLHDGLGGLLSGTAMQAGLMARKLRGGQVVDASEAETVAEQIREAITQTRALSHGLQPVAGEPGALEKALEELARQMGATAEWKCRFETPDGPVGVEDPTAANHLYRIAQEAVHNAVRHSGGNEIVVRLRKKPGGQIRLQVMDNGSGFDPRAAKRNGGLGLRTMEYRARDIGAELKFRRTKKWGTSVECSLRARSGR